MPSFFDLSWAQWALVALLSTQATILSVTVYLHRCQAHRALDVHPVLAHLFRFWLWASTSMSTLEWVAVHRKHHAHCETVQDPHSPKHYGLMRVLFTGSFLYTKARDEQTIERFGRGAPNDWIENQVYRKHRYVGLVALSILYIALFGLLKGGLLATVQVLWIPLWAAGVINGVAHAKGYRNFNSPDESRNLLPWGLWIGGEELHNNHHAHATSAKLSYHWWEVDIGWGFICLLRAMGLAKVKKYARPPKLSREPAACSAAMVRSIGEQQLLVTRWYQTALSSVVSSLRKRDALSRIQARTIKARWLEQADATWHRVVSSHDELALLRARWAELQEVWTNRRLSTEELTQRLTRWCEAAEKSGIGALQEFSLNLRRLPTSGM